MTEHYVFWMLLLSLEGVAAESRESQAFSSKKTGAGVRAIEVAGYAESEEGDSFRLTTRQVDTPLKDKVADGATYQLFAVDERGSERDLGRFEPELLKLVAKCVEGTQNCAPTVTKRFIVYRNLRAGEDIVRLKRNQAKIGESKVSEEPPMPDLVPLPKRKKAQ